MKLTIVIPIYVSDPLHLDFTRQTLATIKTRHDYEVFLIVNFCKPEFKTELKKLVACRLSLVANNRGNILAAAWNLGISKAFESRITNHESRTSDYCLLLNNDILLHPKCIDNLATFAQNHPEFLLWSGTVWPDSRTLAKAKWDGSFSLHPHFSCFMVSPQTIAEAGFFDEHFTMGYFEDNDYHTRILLTGHQTAATTTARFYHYGSRTINVDDNLSIEAKFHYQENRAYFKKKWGLDIHGRAFSPPDTILKEIYPHPFNDKKKT